MVGLQLRGQYCVKDMVGLQIRGQYCVEKSVGFFCWEENIVLGRLKMGL